MLKEEKKLPRYSVSKAKVLLLSIMLQFLTSVSLIYLERKTFKKTKKKATKCVHILVFIFVKVDV